MITLQQLQVKEMKRTILVFIVLALSSPFGFSQETRVFTDPQQKFWEAKEYFQQEQYSLAYPLFKELQQQLRSTDYSNERLVTEEIDYYTTVCGLKQNEVTAADKAKYFISLERNNALNQKMAFHLAEYYFRHNDLRNANIYYELSDINQLSNTEIADMKFHQGYAYFTLKQFDKARPLLNSIRQLPDNANYNDANYYFGFISYYDRKYPEAMDAFRKVEKHPEYGKVVPFYITNIMYFQGQKEKALEYAEANLKSASSLYDVEMKQLMGHVYFEKKDYAKSLTYLEGVKSSGLKLNRETLYELSYSYYESKQFQKAIDGFKQLTEGQDSLSQSAMYLLGDAYLKLGQKANARNAFAFCASNSSNASQKEVSKFNYGKLSYELGFQDIALNELKGFVRDYPNSPFYKEARELLVGLLANTNNYREALEMLEGLQQPSDAAKQLTAKVAFGRAMELIEDQNLRAAEQLLDKVIKDPFNASVISAAHFWKGELSYRQNRTDDAIRSFNNYLSGAAVNR